MKSLIKVMTKGEIRESALKQLQWLGSTVWPQNNLSVRGRKFIGRRGLPDIIGFSRAGLFLACEVKTLNDYLSNDQIEFLNELVAAGGEAYIAKQSLTGAVVLEVWAIQNK